MRTFNKFIGSFLAAAALLASIPVLSAPTPVDLNAKATAPSGIGPLKLGMTREAIDALTTDGGIFLLGPLTPPVAYKSTEGEQRWESFLQSPLTALAAKATFTFKLGFLTHIGIQLDEDSLQRAEAQLSAKYGAPTVTADNEEEQCLYKNGANFKLPKTSRGAAWVGHADDGQRVKVVSYSINHGTCPSNLKYGAVSSIKLYGLTIERLSPDASEPSKKNVF